MRNVLASLFGVCLVLGILNFKLETDRNEKNIKKSASQSAQVVVGEDSDQAAQKENEASKEGANTNQVGNGESGSTSLDEKGNSADTKTKISREVAPYASGAGAWSVSTATKEQKKTYKIVSQIDPRRSISEILESADMSDPETRAAVVAFMSNREEVRYEAVLAKAELLDIPVRLDGPGHKLSILYDFRGEEPLYRTTLNANAAISTSANLIRQTAPYNLDGSGIKVGVWDGGSVRNSHQEFNTTRVVKKNSTVAVNNHATHVAGTIGASGSQASAKGMAPLVAIDSYDWISDSAEMTAVGAATTSDSFTTKIPLSNHSYGFDAVTADMGRYEFYCNQLDALVLSLPYYLVFWAAGNEQTDLPSLGGYQSITFNGLAKNVLTVGAGDDAVTSGVRDVTKGTLASFSSMGPCDDGRIKPDLVANGVGVYSPVSTSDTAYDGTYSGTSMATPNAAGSATLLVQLYSREFSSQRMRSSMLKGLLIHTADDVGRPGPDYQYGWGYLNVKAAADVILAHKASLAAPKMVDDSISNSSKIRSYLYRWDGVSPLKATLCWTDPAGTAQTATDSRTPNLKHNLDLKITAPDGTTIYQPYTMPFVGTWTQASMIQNATKGKNNVDNVERVDLPSPTQTGTYIITVSLDGSLTTTTQAFSLIVTGASSAEANPPPTVSLTPPSNGAAVPLGQSVTLTATAADMATTVQIGSVKQVEFLYGTTVISTDMLSPYSATWIPTSPGTYLLTARATDSEGAVTTSSAVEFSVLSGDGSPVISSFSPASGAAGTSVKITGSNFSGVTAVRFNGSPSTSYTVNSLTQITAILPGVATTGKISVTNSFGTGTSATDFVVVPIVLSEDFAALTSGDNTSIINQLTAWAGDTLFPTVVKAYQAGGAVKLGSNSASGSITSKALDLSGGAFDVSFDVKGWTTVEGGIVVTATGQPSQTVTYTSVRTGSFETKVVRFSSGTAATTITLATTAKRAFLDNIIVTKSSLSVTAPVISSFLAQSGMVGTAFNYQITASSSPISYGATGLPGGLGINTSTGVITGTPTVAGTSNVTISATNASGTGSATLVITVNSSASAPVISSSLAQSGAVGTAFNYQITASGSPTSFGATGLPAGLLLASGTITGTPAAAGTFNVSISATNGSGTGTAQLVITIDPVGAVIPAVNVSGTLAAVNTTYGTASSVPTSFTVSGLNLTEGIRINPPSGYEISQTVGGASGYAATQTVGAAGTVAAKTIYVRLTATTPVGTYSGNVTCNSAESAGATVATVASYVGKKQLTISGLVGVDKIYNGTTATQITGTPTYVGLANGDDLSVTGVPSASFSDKNVGVGKTVTISGFTDPNGNYSVTAPTVTATISPKEVVIVELGAANKPYDGTLSGTLTGTANLLGVELVDQASVVLGGTPLVSFVSENAGAGIGLVVSGYVLSGGEAPNYQVVQPAGLSADISPRPATIQANDQSKTAGILSSFGAGQSGFTSQGLAVGEEISTVTLTVSGGAEADGAAGLYSITPSNPIGVAFGRFRAGNYAFTYINGTLTVVPTFANWAGEGVAMTPELLMMYAIGGATSPSTPGERPETKLEGTVLSLTAIVRKDATLTIIGQAVTDLGNYGNSGSITQVRGSAVGISQDGVPAGCERQKFAIDMGSTGKGFIRFSVTK